MQKLALSDLIENGYTEDRATKRAFERPYRWASVLGLVIALGPYPITRFIWSPFSDRLAHLIAIAVFVAAGAGICFGAAVLAGNGTPVSIKSGTAMQRYLRSDVPDDFVEYLFVDSESHTYFVFRAGQPNWSGV